jgi:hypothetical protein
MMDDSKHCGCCTFVSFPGGTCRPWCKVRGRHIPAERYGLGCEYWDDWKEKSLEGVEKQLDQPSHE